MKMLQLLIQQLNSYSKNFKIKSFQGLSNTLWHGRIEEIKSGNIIKYRNNVTILDGAHNIDGAVIIRKFLEKQTSPKWNLIIGMLNNRDIKRLLENLRIT